MTEPITIQSKEVRRRLGDMLDNVGFAHKSYLITRQKKPTGVLMGYEEYEALVEMLDTMAEQLDPEFQASLIEGRKEIEAGRGIPLDDLKEKLFSSK